MGILDTAKVLQNAQKARSKMKSSQGVGVSDSGMTAISLNGIYDLDIEFQDELFADLNSSKLKKEISQAYVKAKKDLEKKLAANFDVNSLKDLIGG